MDLERRLEELEKRVEALEVLVQEQPREKINNDYELDFGKPKLLKQKKRKLFNNSK